jgi:hypothetical protein
VGIAHLHYLRCKVLRGDKFKLDSGFSFWIQAHVHVSEPVFSRMTWNPLHQNCQGCWMKVLALRTPSWSCGSGLHGQGEGGWF